LRVSVPIPILLPIEILSGILETYISVPPILATEDIDDIATELLELTLI
jgi:hypothetical protein